MIDNNLDNLLYEKMLVSQGFTLIAGVDEVGRGPLAGPVVTAAVIMNLDEIILGITDSKKLSEKKRILLNEKILASAISVKIAMLSERDIDEINILEATKKCMLSCVNLLSPSADAVIIDAVNLNLGIKTVSLVKGDLLSYSVGAASIVAKVYRDNLMAEYAKEYPQYGFERNKGYGTKEHIDAIKKYGPCEIHRKSFIRNFI